MCGLVGICTTDLSLVHNALLNGLEALVHRGPDDSGTYKYYAKRVVGLGLRRLAIQDLSISGHQPMESDDGRYVVVFNGEIANFQELRSRLQTLGFKFKSNSDTEVLLYAWVHFGEECLRIIEGMYAFSVLDKLRNVLTLVRDPFGIKPLYYSQKSAHTFLFSSEIDSLMKMSKMVAKANWQRSIDYLLWGHYDESHESFIQNVNQILPGHLIYVDVDTGSVSRQKPYWLPLVSDIDVSFDDAAKHVRELFLESVKRNLIADVPVGIALSGGVDSSAILRSAAFVNPNSDFYAFSYIAEGQPFSERKWIDKAIDGLNVKRRSILIGSDELARDLDDLIIAQGEPFGSTSVYASWRVFKAVREDGIVVTLDGQGADEVFAGYDGYPSARLRTLISSGKFLEASDFIREWSKWPGRSSLSAIKGLLAESSSDFVYATFGKLIRRSDLPNLNRSRLGELGVDLNFSRRVLVPHIETSRNHLKNELLSGLRYRGLPALLRHGDRNSMAASVESRVPFLDRELVDYVFSLPENFLVGGNGETKSVLRSAMSGIVPADILNRRDKIGFETPQAEWLNPVFLRHGRHLEGLISESKIFESKVSETGSFFERLRASPSASWRVINYFKWAELHNVDISLK